MTSTRQPTPSLYSQLEVSPATLPTVISPRDEHAELLREVLTAQDRTNELLEELVGVMATTQKQCAKRTESMAQRPSEFVGSLSRSGRSAQSRANRVSRPDDGRDQRLE